MQIKFGTDGWRAIIAREFTTENVARVAYATAQWLTANGRTKVIIGHDARFGGPMFAEVAARVLCASGIKVRMATTLVTTPMISLACKVWDSHGLVITASHNAPEFNGIKLKANYGGPVLPESIAEIEALIPNETEIPSTTIEAFKSSGILEYVDLESLYMDMVKREIDMEAIRKAGLVVAFDAMWGAARSIVPRLIPDIIDLHSGSNPGMNGRQPEPLLNNLRELEALIRSAHDIDMGFANDGDADRIGVFDEQGNYIDAHHTILLLIYYLVKYKGLRGKVYVTFSVSDRVRSLCNHFGLEYGVTPIGFKHICSEMLEHDTLLGAEESGGIAVKGHLPERDGVWNALLLLEFMAVSGKSLSELIAEVYEITGSFTYQRDDVALSPEDQQSILAQCDRNAFSRFGEHTIVRKENMDGYKFYLDKSSWVMIRPSVTEPVLRVYAESNEPETVRAILQATHLTLSEL